MRKLILIPLLLISAFGFSQRIDTILGFKGKLIKDTAITIDGNYLFTPSQNHISFDSTKIPWRPNGNKIYYNNGYVGIGTKEPRARLFIADSTILPGQASDSSGIALINDSSNTSPSLLFQSKTSVGKVRYRITAAEEPGGQLKVESSLNNAAYAKIFNIDVAGNATLAGKITTSGGVGSNIAISLTVPQVVSTFLSAGGYPGTAPSLALSGNFYMASGTNNGSGVSAQTTITSISGTNTYTGFYFNPTLTKTIGAKIYGFQNVVGDNKFHTTRGSSGFGVAANTDIDGSAKVEIKDTTKGFLLPRMTKAQRNKIISSVTGTIVGGSLASSTFSNVVMNGGSGTGLIADIITTTGSGVTSVVFTSLGSGYVAGDILTATGFTGFTYTISAVGAPATGLEIWQTDNTPGPRWYDGTNWNKVTLTAD